jgi:hypothetical protein
MATNKKAFAAKVLAELASDSNTKDEIRLQAAQNLAYMDPDSDLCSNTEIKAWYETDTKDLAHFFLRCVFAAVPSAILVLSLYICLAIFTQVVPSILGLQ